jgi:D-erythro-7,8-dihydroneopterin triphosphate epimerase
MLIRIKNLRLRTIIGVEDWERRDKQDVVVNAEIEVDASRAAESDDLTKTVDYKTITKDIIRAVEGSDFRLLETLAQHVLKIILQHEGVLAVRVEVDKPHALRFADSVSVFCWGRKTE